LKRLVKLAAPLAAALAALALAACQAQDGSNFDAKVKAYLMAHPDDLRKALENMQSKEQANEEKQQATEEASALAALPGARAALERDPGDFVANPGGRITVAEFYDYRCPHCINIAPKVVSLIRSHPDVRFVFKEMPIFGAVSEHAARAALAAKTQGKDYVGLYEAFMADRGLSDADIDRLAAAKGVDIAQMNATANVAAANAHIAAVADLAKRLAVDGTPTFVIGDTFVRGEDDDGLSDAIKKAEAKRA
jgi:protein-disulfide isomerase